MSLDPERLRRLREGRALSQDGLAGRCGLSRKTIQRMEQGEPVRAETMAFVAAALEVAVTDFSRPESRRRPEADGDDAHLALRRISSGNHVLHQLSLTEVGRIECDVDANGQNIDQLTRLVGLLQSLMREDWSAPRPPASLPLLDRLRTIASLNEDLEVLSGQGVSLYMGHYYRFAATAGGALDPGEAEAQQRPLVLTRIYITQSTRDRMRVTIDKEWLGAPEGLAEPGGLSDLLTPNGDARVFLYDSPPLRPTDDVGDRYIDAQFNVVG